MKKREEILSDIKKVYNDLEEKRIGFLNHKYTKYVVSYEIEGDHIKVLSNIGNYRYIKNTRSNIKKLNQTIVKNKILIAEKIDEYESNSNERLTVFIVNAIVLCLSGMFTVLSFFTGIYLLFLLSILIFSLCTVCTSIIGIDYYVLVNEISNLKSITGYKKDNEFKLPSIDIKALKSR